MGVQESTRISAYLDRMGERARPLRKDTLVREVITIGHFEPLANCRMAPNRPEGCGVWLEGVI